MLTHVLPFRATERKGGDGGSGVGEQGRNLQRVGGAEREGRGTPTRLLFWTQAFLFSSRLVELDGSVCKHHPDDTFLSCFGALLSLFYSEIFGTHTVQNGGGKISKGLFATISEMSQID